MRWLVIVAPLLLGACALFGQQPRYVVYFEEWSADLDRPARGAIAEAADWARRHPAQPLLVRGFADPSNPASASKGISARRAKAVSDTLVADGIEAARIRRVALGGVPFTFDSQESRRVEIVLGPEGK